MKMQISSFQVPGALSEWKVAVCVGLQGNGAPLWFVQELHAHTNTQTQKSGTSRREGGAR